MIAIPAIDLRDGFCVQLVGGSYAAERVRRPDPVAIAREFSRLGFTRLHVVDLDAATGRGSNEALMREVIREARIDVQAGGGLRDDDRVAETLEAGARWAVLGTRALQDIDWLAELASARPDEIILALDVRRRRIVVEGWNRSLPRSALDLVSEVAGLPLAGILVTCIDREGRLEGPDLHLVEDVVDAAGVPVLASGGIATLAHLRNLDDRGAAGAVIGTALYLGTLSPSAVASEFAA
ncbi:MAG TPA: 1-(5-phosphoribosyl)-5-[(5-phosphoribosylamino)methylideneamino] imidazole-4-carboxamide isomerase [Gemmatimonadaceae bacterium]